MVCGGSHIELRLVVPNFLSGDQFFKKQPAVGKVIETYKNVADTIFNRHCFLYHLRLRKTRSFEYRLRCIHRNWKTGCACFWLFSLERSEFFLLGILIVGGWFSGAGIQFFRLGHAEKKQAAAWKKTILKMERKFLIRPAFGRYRKESVGIMALKNGITSGKISLILLNILCSSLNYWSKICLAGILPSAKRNMAAYVHEGAWLLILSIVLAMLLLPVLFPE